MPSLPKKIADLQMSDIDQLIADSVAEDEQLEFKRELPAKDGKPDRWYAAQDQFGDRARNELLEEVVGFANAYGGDLVLGIGESNGNPPRATSKHPVPACEELAHRLELAARDCIEPPLPRLEIRGIPVGTGGAGYVVIRTTTSAIGPHRLRPTRECYRRSASRTEAMTMRQIQDHTLAMARSADQLEARHRSLRERFAREMGTPLTQGFHGRLGLRVSAVPAQADIAVEKVHDIGQVQPLTNNWILRGSNLREQRLHYVAHSSPWRRVLRGTESRTSARPGSEAVVRLSCNGGISFELFIDSRPEDSRPGFCLYPGWLMCMVANAVASAARFREYSGYVGVEYGFEVEIAVLGANLKVLELGDSPFMSGVGEISPTGVVFPRYALGPDQTVLDAFRPFYVDFWANIGVDGERDLLTELKPA